VGHNPVDREESSSRAAGAEGMSSKAAAPVIANVRSSIEFASDWVKVVPGGE
jgi:hypothetical protein